MSQDNFDLAQFVDVFMEECGEHLATLETSVLDLERRADDELLNRLFRAAHSIKGGAAMFGFARIAELTHGLESVLDAMRDHRLSPTPDLIDLLLRGTDAVSALLRTAGEGDASVAIEDLLARCSLALQPPAEPSGAREVRIHLQPGRDVFRHGLDPMLGIRDLASVAELIAVEVDTSRLPPLAEIDPDSSYIGWRLRVRTAADPGELEARLAFLGEGGQVEVEPVEAIAPPAVAPVRPPDPPAIQASAAPDVPAPAPEVPAASPAPAAPAPAAARATAPPAAPAPRAPVPTETASIRVAIEKVDRLMNLVGELVINQSMVAQVVQDFTPDRLGRLQEAVSEMERNTRELQERVMSIRMVPVSSVFGRVPRMVHDLATKLDKQVEVEMRGEDTELDKSVAERLVDPLTHLVRNALDHGIESREARRASGKPDKATVRLEAYHRGGNVVIEVHDDGRGLDPHRIRAKAIERGVPGAEQATTDAEAQALIFVPGFSTSEKVSDVSGRGVGLDVVKRNVDSLNGSVAIESHPGQGSCFRINLPLTLAILDGLCVLVGKQVFVVPLTAIVESLQPAPDQLHRVFARGEVVRVRGETVPLVRLYQALGISGSCTDPTEGLVVIVEDGGQKVGLLVDDLIGQAQVVIKSLETHYQRVDGLMGATILGDGQVALILDVQKVARAGQCATEPAPASWRQEAASV